MRPLFSRSPFFTLLSRRRAEIPPSLTERTFILGVGAQKAGTTWLHNYLLQRDDIFVPFLGELHFFDSLWLDEPRRLNHRLFIERLKLRVAGLDSGTGLPPGEVDRLGALVDRLAMFDGGIEAYHRFFAMRVAPEHTHFGEITPSYAMLPKAAFAQIGQLYPRIKVIFIMRDPVDRMISAIQMAETAQPPDARSKRNLAGILANPGYLDRTRYEVTVENLRSAFAEDALFFAFYETLFCDATLRVLCDFLGVPFRGGPYKERIRAGTPTAPFTAADIAAVRNAFEPTYAFCRREFGPAVPGNWRV